MKDVLDASVAVQWVVPEPDSPRAIAVRDGGYELIAPDVFIAEVAHALTRAERKGILQQGEASDSMADVLAFAPAFFSSLDLISHAIDLSSRTRSSVYDCLYVALAEHESCELVTADTKLMRNLADAPIRDIASFTPRDDR